jgi:hypothetical protein
MKGKLLERTLTLRRNCTTSVKAGRGRNFTPPGVDTVVGDDGRELAGNGDGFKSTRPARAGLR